MTSTPFTSGGPSADGHPDVPEISALTEGMLSPERSTALRTHLADCVLCADVRASLEQIRDALGTLPGPARMPADVEGRIAAALAAEALLDASPSAPPEDDAVSRETAPGVPRPVAAAVSRETSAARAENAGTPRSTGPERPSVRPGGTTGPGRHRP
ncbi:MAG: hypothetical protein ACRDP3_20995, partial [Streptomyces sp.]